MNKAKLNYWIDVGMGLSFLVAFFTGIFKWPGLLQRLGIDPFKVPLLKISNLHDRSGLIMGLFALAHIVLHWGWIIAMTKSLGKRKDKKEGSKIIPAILLIALISIAGCTSTEENNGGETEGSVSEPAIPQLTCPKGFVDDPYPGRCGSYIDTDNNGICDYGQSS